MSLDFTAINGIPQQGEKEERTDPAENAYRLDGEKRERENARQMYATYQQNIKRSGTLRDDITKGLKAGEDPLNLLLKAVECISLMTGESVILAQCKEDLLAVYGWGMGEHAPLEAELGEARKRLAMLTRPELLEDPQNSQRIQTAIQAHRDLIERLERAISANKTDGGEL